MIRIFATVFLIIHCLASYSQWITGNKPKAFALNNFPDYYYSSEKSGGSLMVNYDLSDETEAGSLNYKRAIWHINQNYDTLSADSLFTYIVCGFDSLIDPTNTYAYSFSAIPSFQIDSFWIVLGHENNSGLNDTLIVQLITLNTSGYPTNQIIWADTLVFSTGQSTSNQWTHSFVLGLAPLINWTLPLKPAIKLQYKSPLQDTLGIVAGYRVSGTCGTNDAAQWSAFYPNSYAYWTGFNALIPTAAGGDIYYDCNANLQFDSLTDGRNYIQNWHIGIQISAPEIGLDHLDDEEITLSPKIFPNPASDWLNIHSELAIDEVKIFDIEGKTIMSFNNIDGLISLQQLDNGMYFVQIKTATHAYVKKFLVHHRLD